MVDLMLVRHAKSDWHRHKSDMDRPLNGRGVKDALHMGEYLKRLGVVPDRMIVSSAQRTQETAELLNRALSLPDKHIIIDKELYLADRQTLQEIIEVYATDNRRLLVLAHNPGMDDLVSYLASEPPPLSFSGKLMVTCAVACFQLDSLKLLNKRGQCKLLSLFRPKEIS